jgi:hypothetical protein
MARQPGSRQAVRGELVGAPASIEVQVGLDTNDELRGTVLDGRRIARSRPLIPDSVV